MKINKLQQLKTMTKVVADTGDIEAIKKFAPMDATTNPSLLYKAAQLPQYASILEQAIAWSANQGGSTEGKLKDCVDKLAVDIGVEILKFVPGRISTEVDSSLSFDRQATIKKAYRLVELYNKAGISQDRVLIKIASTWEGIRAAETLEKDGINCNLTLIFSFAQAVACADAGAYLISPFVGRLSDWHKAQTGKSNYSEDMDPGVEFVHKIFNYYKSHDYATIIMGASFRNTGQIQQLAGCDRLTISPDLLEKLQNDETSLERKLYSRNPQQTADKYSYEEKQFRWELNENAMATEKLAEGIRKFTADQKQLESFIARQ